MGGDHVGGLFERKAALEYFGCNQSLAVCQHRRAPTAVRHQGFASHIALECASDGAAILSLA